MAPSQTALRGIRAHVCATCANDLPTCIDKKYLNLAITLEGLPTRKVNIGYTGHPLCKFENMPKACGKGKELTLRQWGETIPSKSQRNRAFVKLQNSQNIDGEEEDQQSAPTQSKCKARKLPR